MVLLQEILPAGRGSGHGKRAGPGVGGQRRESVHRGHHGGYPAGDYYATQLNDIIPTLYQQAYDRYLNEYSMMLQDLGTVNTQEQLDYAKYLDQLTQYNTDRNFAYDTYLGDFNILQGQLASLQSQDDVDYGRLLDQINLGLQQDQTRYEREWNESERDYQRGQNEKSIAQAQVDAILAAGGTPSADLVGASRLYQRVCAGAGGGLQAGAGAEPEQEFQRERREFRRKEQRRWNGVQQCRPHHLPDPADADGPGRERRTDMWGPGKPRQQPAG